jgi:hypothetical protein
MDTLVRRRAAGKRGLRRWWCLVISVGRSAARNRGLLRRPRRCPVRRCADRRHVRARSDWRMDWGRRRIRGEPHPQCHAADANRSKHAHCNGGSSHPHGSALRVLRRNARTGCHGAHVQGIAMYRRCADLEVPFSDVFEQIWEPVTNGVPDGARNAALPLYPGRSRWFFLGTVGAAGRVDRWSRSQGNPPASRLGDRRSAAVSAWCCDGVEPSHPLRKTATVQHLDHAPNSPGSGSTFTISGIGSPRTIRAEGDPPTKYGLGDFPAGFAGPIGNGGVGVEWRLGE